VAIDIPLMLVHLRSRVVEAKREGHRVPSPEQALMASAAWTMADPGRWGRALRAARVGRLLGGRRRRISTLPPPLAGWTSTRDLPLPPRETFRGWWARRRGAGTAGGAAGRDGDPDPGGGR
jgi:L-lactate dehydrogenase complex protein LldF